MDCRPIKVKDLTFPCASWEIISNNRRFQTNTIIFAFSYYMGETLYLHIHGECADMPVDSEDILFIKC
jgi:hypothetical protein